MIRSITIIVALFSLFLTSVFFSGCERIQQLIPPENIETTF